MTISQLRQYRKLKGRKLLLQSEIDKLILSGMEIDSSDIKWREKEVERLNREMKSVRDYFDSIEPYISTMLRMHYIEGRRWKDIAQRVGGGNTQDSIRKMCHRYISKNKTS